MLKKILFLCLLLTTVFTNKLDGLPIRYGSLLRIRAPFPGYYIHSHEITLGPQGPNSVTGFNQDDNDANSLWSIQQQHPKSTKSYQDEVKCGDVVTLHHALTQTKLRTHQGATGLTSTTLQLVHASRGNTEYNNNWKIQCTNNEEGDTFKFGLQFRLLHVTTQKYVRFSNSQPYNQFNCGRGCVLIGQIELHAVKESGKESNLKAISGMTFTQ